MDGGPQDIHGATSPQRALSTAQERRLVDHLDARFLEINRGFKKRYEPDSSLPSLSAYLSASHPLLSLILMIAPIGPSASLRAALLLRLSGDVLEAVPGYSLSGPSPTLDDISDAPLQLTAEDNLLHLLEWFTELDKGWLAVLQAQAWDLVLGEGTGTSQPLSTVSQTDRTRLRSILLQGKQDLDDWLGSGQVILDEEAQEGFGALFWRTLRFLDASGEVMPHEVTAI